MGATATGLTIDHDETQSKAQIRTKIKNQFHAVMKQDQKQASKYNIHDNFNQTYTPQKAFGIPTYDQNSLVERRTSTTVSDKYLSLPLNGSKS